MPKKIVILNGSPRKKGNTSALVKAFTQGAENNKEEHLQSHGLPLPSAERMPFRAHAGDFRPLLPTQTGGQRQS